TATTQPSQPPPSSERARTAWPKGALSDAGWSSTSTTSRYVSSRSGRIRWRVPKRGWTPPSWNGSPRRSEMRCTVAAKPSGPAANERWSSLMSKIGALPPSRRDTGGRSGLRRIGRVHRQPGPRGQVGFAIRRDNVVPRLPHELDQLRRVGDEHGLDGHVGLGVAAAVPVEVVPPRPPAAAAVLGDRDLRVSRV